MNKKKVMILLICLVLFAGVLSLFPRKVKFQETMTVCSFEGETLLAQFDVELWKYWYMEDEMHGTITVDDMVYVSGIDEYPGENWKIDDHVFLVPMNYGLDWLDNFIEIDLVDNSFETVRMLLKKDDTYKAYFGPAETMEEVEKIVNEISDK
ncbi:MAG: hypothetical protein J6K04_09000 [Lachnospiraceae bacterium]|nr:hypothetical protein [Lachnospiraceae bacterium]